MVSTAQPSVSRGRTIVTNRSNNNDNQNIEEEDEIKSAEPTQISQQIVIVIVPFTYHLLYGYELRALLWWMGGTDDGAAMRFNV